MKFTEEMINEDEKRWHARDVVTELGYCGNYMRDRKDMKNIDIRFYAYIMRKAYYLLKKQVAKPMTEYDDGWDCPRCGLKLVGKTASGYPCDELDLPNDEIVKYCPVCGQAVKWE